MRALTRSAVFALLLSAPALQADEPSAEALFQEGRAAMLEHRYAEACPKLARSQELEPRLGTLLNLAVCHEELGKVASAWSEYQRALAQAKAEGDTTRARLASERVESLGPRVPRLTVIADRAARDRIEIRLDDAALSPERWNDEVPLDPGEHHVLATAAGRVLLEESFTLTERERKQLSVVEPAPAPAASGAPAPPAPTATPARSDAPPPRVPAPAPARRLGPWVVELGVFAGLMVTDYSYPNAVSPEAFALRQRTTGTITSCSAVSCRYAMDHSAGVVGGLHVFGGYALSNELVVGARLMVGPRLGGGALTVIGPSVVLHAGGDFWLGASFLFGDGTARGDGHATPPAEYQLLGTEPRELDGKLAGGFGGMLHADLVLHETERGAVVASALPLALFGSQGSVWAIPLAIGYRFQ